MKIIFLDIDGVLNGYRPYSKILYKICKLFHIEYEIFGVSEYRVMLLWLLIKLTGAKVVLSSSWRFWWYKPYEEKDDMLKLLDDKLKKYNIPVIGITPESYTVYGTASRAVEIVRWMRSNDPIESFVILDDEECLFDKLKDRLILTVSKRYQGITLKHVIRAIRILNKENK